MRRPIVRPAQAGAALPTAAAPPLGSGGAAERKRRPLPHGSEGRHRDAPGRGRGRGRSGDYVADSLSDDRPGRLTRHVDAFSAGTHEADGAHVRSLPNTSSSSSQKPRRLSSPSRGRRDAMDFP